MVEAALDVAAVTSARASTRPAVEELRDLWPQPVRPCYGRIGGVNNAAITFRAALVAVLLLLAVAGDAIARVGELGPGRDALIAAVRAGRPVGGRVAR